MEICRNVSLHLELSCITDLIILFQILSVCNRRQLRDILSFVTEKVNRVLL